MVNLGLNAVCLGALLVLVLLVSQFPTIDGKCAELGQKCRRSFFRRCCGSFVCELKNPFNGVCVKCLEGDKSCLRNNDCCSGRCSWGRCQRVPEININVNTPKEEQRGSTEVEMTTMTMTSPASITTTPSEEEEASEDRTTDGEAVETTTEPSEA